MAKVLEDVLGYHGFNEITREQQIKGKYVDLAIKIDGSIKFLIEVKSAGTELRDRHIEQAQHYASTGNIRWVVLTNGTVWNLYHLSFDEGIEYETAYSINLNNDDFNKASEKLSVLHRQSVTRGGLEEFWNVRTALGPPSIGKAIFNAETLKLIRRIIRKNEGIIVDEEDLGKAIQSMFSAESREQIGPFKIRRKSAPKKRVAKNPDDPTPQADAQLSDNPIAEHSGAEPVTEA